MLHKVLPVAITSLHCANLRACNQQRRDLKQKVDVGSKKLYLSDRKLQISDR